MIPGQGLGLGKLAHNTALTLGRQLAAGALQLVLAALVARALGSEGYGQYAVALLLPTMLSTFLSIGIGPANVYYLAAGKVDTVTVLHAVNRLALLIVVIGLGIGILTILFFSEKLFPDLSHVILWSALSIFPFSLFQSFLSSIFQGLQKFKIFNLILLTQPVVTLVIVMALILLCHPRVEYILAAQLFGSVVVVCVGLMYIRKEACRSEETEHMTGYIRQVLSYGYKAHLSNILAFINYKVDIFLVNLFINPAAAGVYVVAVQIVERLWLLSQSVSTVVLPRLSELSANEESRKELTPIICRMVLATTLLLALLLGTLAYPLVVIIFGKEYTGSITALLLLLPGIVSGSGSRVLANDIAARGRPELNMYFSAIVVVVNVAGNIILIPKFNLAGAAMATTAAYILNFLLRLIVYSKISGNHLTSPLLITKQDIIKIKNMLATRR